MSKFYATINTDRNRKTTPTATGTKHIQAVAQSYDGSMSVQLYYDEDKNLNATIGYDRGTSTSRPTPIWDGPVIELVKVLMNNEHHI